jgi:hypothetical protein
MMWFNTISYRLLYDPSGLGFEFKLPFDGRYQPIFETEKVKPNRNPNYQTSPSPEPTYSPPSTIHCHLTLNFLKLNLLFLPMSLFIPCRNLIINLRHQSTFHTLLCQSIQQSKQLSINTATNILTIALKLVVTSGHSPGRLAKDCVVWYDLVLITTAQYCLLQTAGWTTRNLLSGSSP